MLFKPTQTTVAENESRVYKETLTHYISKPYPYRDPHTNVSNPLLVHPLYQYNGKQGDQSEIPLWQ